MSEEDNRTDAEKIHDLVEEINVEQAVSGKSTTIAKDEED